MGKISSNSANLVLAPRESLFSYWDKRNSDNGCGCCGSFCGCSVVLLLLLF